MTNPIVERAFKDGLQAPIADQIAAAVAAEREACARVADTWSKSTVPIVSLAGTLTAKAIRARS